MMSGLCALLLLPALFPYQAKQQPCFIASPCFDSQYMITWCLVLLSALLYRSLPSKAPKKKDNKGST
jgi:hypothetical protein